MQDDVSYRDDREYAASGDRPRRSYCRGDKTERKAAHRTEAAIDQAEKRHDSAAIGLIGVNLQQRRHAGKKSRLKAAGYKQKEQRKGKIAGHGEAKNR